MRRFFLLGLLALASTLTSSGALAAAPTPSVHPVFEDDGAFGYCLSEMAYPDGRKLTFAFSPQGEINLSVTIPQAGFQMGGHYDLSVQLGAEEARQIRARALNDDALLFQMGGSASFQTNLSNAASLSLGAGSRRTIFDLPPMGQVLNALKTCTAESRSVRAPVAASASAAPAASAAAIDKPRDVASAMRTGPAASERPAQQAAPAAPQRGAPLPAALADLLSRAGIKRVVPLSMADVPQDQRPADFLWQTGKILGGVRERSVPKETSLTDLIGLHMQGLKRKCAGAFKAVVEREQTAPMLHLRTAEATCAPPKGVAGQPVMVGLVYSLTSEGILTVLTHEGYDTYKAKILKNRDALAQIIMDDMNKPNAKP